MSEGPIEKTPENLLKYRECRQRMLYWEDRLLLHMHSATARTQEWLREEAGIFNKLKSATEDFRTFPEAWEDEEWHRPE